MKAGVCKGLQMATKSQLGRPLGSQQRTACTGYLALGVAVVQGCGLAMGAVVLLPLKAGCSSSCVSTSSLVAHGTWRGLVCRAVGWHCCLLHSSHVLHCCCLGPAGPPSLRRSLHAPGIGHTHPQGSGLVLGAAATLPPVRRQRWLAGPLTKGLPADWGHRTPGAADDASAGRGWLASGSVILLSHRDEQGLETWVEPVCAGSLALGVGIYAVLWLALGGEVMLPFGVGWSVFLIWACAHVGGYAATQVHKHHLYI